MVSRLIDFCGMINLLGPVTLPRRNEGGVRACSRKPVLSQNPLANNSRCGCLSNQKQWRVSLAVKEHHEEMYDRVVFSPMSTRQWVTVPQVFSHITGLSLPTNVHH